MEIKSVKSFVDYGEKIREGTSRIIESVSPVHVDFPSKPGKFTIRSDQIYCHH